MSENDGPPPAPPPTPKTPVKPKKSKPPKLQLTHAEIEEYRKEQVKMMEMLNAHIASHPVRISFPCEVKPPAESGASRARTDPDFVNVRLLESGLFSPPRRGRGKSSRGKTMGETSAELHEFIEELKSTDCYENVKAHLDMDSSNPPSDGPLAAKLRIELREKNWYQLYVGGGIKPENALEAGNALFPKLQFESSATFRNLRGVTDKTKVAYGIDQTSSPTASVSHDVPLHAGLGGGWWRDFVLRRRNLVDDPSKLNLNLAGLVETVDWEHFRSYKEFVRGASVKVETGMTGGGRPEALGKPYQSLSYNVFLRDLIPRRHNSLPYSCDASIDIISHAGPNLLHSFKYTKLLNGFYLDDKYNPTKGYDYSLQAELACPPGDVGFWKANWLGAWHLPLFSKWTKRQSQQKDTDQPSCALHFNLSAGLMKHLPFQGLCRNASYVGDRFFVGGPMQLRGFGCNGIGPRARSGGSTSPGGDSLGGEMFYAASLSLSAPLPLLSQKPPVEEDDSFLPKTPSRRNYPSVFCFLDAGTLTGWGVPLRSAFGSTRASAGVGVAYGMPTGGRLEATYAVPLRYGPRDVRKNLQVGFGFSFG